MMTSQILEFKEESDDNVSLTNMDGSQPIVYEDDNIEEYTNSVEKLESQLYENQQIQKSPEFLSEELLPSQVQYERLSEKARQIIYKLRQQGVVEEFSSDDDLFDFLYLSYEPNEEISQISTEIKELGDINQDMLEFINNLQFAIDENNYYMFINTVEARFGRYPFHPVNFERIKEMIEGGYAGGDLLLQKGRKAMKIAVSEIYSKDMRVEKFNEFLQVLGELLNDEE